MKKTLLCLVIGMMTFSLGVLTYSFLSFTPQTVTPSAFEAEKLFEIKRAESNISLLELPEPVTTDSPDPNEPDSYEIEREKIYGWYALEKYNGMKEVDMILLSRELDYENNRRKIISHGAVFTSLGGDPDKGYFQSVSASVGKRKVSFRTEQKFGREYRFEGKFLSKRTKGENGEKLLYGTLKKFVKGKKVAEVSGKFKYYEPHCWH